MREWGYPSLSVLEQKPEVPLQLVSNQQGPDVCFCSRSALIDAVYVAVRGRGLEESRVASERMLSLVVGVTVFPPGTLKWAGREEMSLGEVGVDFAHSVNCKSYSEAFEAFLKHR